MSLREKCDVSVVIPAHRVDANLLRSMRSVINQSLMPLELIVVFDGVSPGQKFLRQHFDGVSVRYFVIKENRGPAVARNLGINHAQGKFIAFLDSDDLWYPDKLKNQIEEMERHGSLRNVICVSPVVVLSSSKKPLIRYPVVGSSDKIRLNLKKWPYLYLGSTLLVHKTTLITVGLQNENIRVYEDFDWQIRLSQQDKFVVLCSGKLDVLINKGSSIREIGDLIRGFKQILKTLDASGKPSYFFERYAFAMYRVDLAKIYLSQGLIMRAIINLLLSFIFVPRLSIYNGSYWLKSDEN